MNKFSWMETVDIEMVTKYKDYTEEQKEKQRTDNSPSLDRIDNSSGYVKGNVHIISMRANRIKSDATLQELKSVVKYLDSIK